MTATRARLNTDIKTRKKVVAENQEAFDQTIAIREKVLMEVNAEEERDVLQAILALKVRNPCAEKHNGGALL